MHLKVQRHCLLGSEFKIETNHQSWRYLTSQANMNRRHFGTREKIDSFLPIFWILLRISQRNREEHIISIKAP